MTQKTKGFEGYDVNGISNQIKMSPSESLVL